MRERIRMIAGAVAILAVGVGGGIAVAAMQRTPTHRGSSDTGSIAEAVVFTRHQARGLVQVFNAAGRLAARDDVRHGDQRFHFILKPGQANHTNHITLSEGCGSGTY
jgi:hypothetical protein